MSQRTYVNTRRAATSAARGRLRGAAPLRAIRYAAACAAFCIMFALAVPSAAQTAGDLVREVFAAKEWRQFPYAIQLFDEALRRGEFAPD